MDLTNRMIISILYDHVPKDAELSRKHPYYYGRESADILIIGASRGNYSYNVEMIRDSLQLSCYSASNEGASIVSQYLSLVKFCEVHIPIIVILDASSIQLQESWVKDKISMLYPFYWKDKRIKEVIDDIDGKNKCTLMICSFIQYNSTIYDLIVDGYLKKRNDLLGHISIPYSGKAFKIDDNLTTANSINSKLCAQGIEYLDKIVELCNSKGIKLIICDSPRLNNAKDWDDFLNDYSRQNNLEFWNYSDLDEVVSDSRFFVDLLHVNEKGAVLFTLELIDRLKRTI